jgi:type II secretory pathway pseudopilin PulG
MRKVKQRKATLFMLHHLSGNNKGISIIELLVGAGILTLSLSALLGFLAFTVTTSSFLKQQAEATALAQEALEVVRNVRDGTGWEDEDPQNEYDGLGRLQTGIAYRVALSGDIPPRWQLIAGLETLGMFLRSVIFESAQRDVDDNIVESGGVQDPNTKKVSVTVSWTTKTKQHEVVIVSYFTNWRQ